MQNVVFAVLVVVTFPNMRLSGSVVPALNSKLNICPIAKPSKLADGSTF